MSLDLASVAADEIVAFYWLGGAGQAGSDHFAPRPYKHYRFEAPAITAQVQLEASGVVVTLSAQKPAFFVTLETDIAGRFEDNVVDLIPGRPMSLRFLPEGGLDAADLERTLVVRSLYGSYAG